MTQHSDTSSSDTSLPTRSLIVRTLLQSERGAGSSASASLDDSLPLGPGGLGVSSLLLLQVFVRLEEQLGFAFDDAAVANAQFTTVGELVTFVEDALRRQELDRLGVPGSPALGGG